MTVTEATKLFAVNLADLLLKKDPEDPLIGWLKRIAAMPEYDDLGAWESFVQSYELPWDEKEGRPEVQLAEEIFEFGRLNMYCGFQWFKTKAEYRRIRGLLEAAGVLGLPKAKFMDLRKF